MKYPAKKPLSSLSLEDTQAIFPSLRYKFGRSGLSVDKKEIICPITGAILTSSADFNTSGVYGFTIEGATPSQIVTGANFASTFTTKDMLFILNADITTGGSITVGNNDGVNNVIDSEMNLNTSPKYIYLDYNNHFSNVPATNISGGIGSLCGAIAPFDNLIEKYAAYLDGTTAVEKVVGANNAGSDFDSANWIFKDKIRLTKAIPIYNIYILEFINGRPPDEIIKQGLIWMTANRDKGLPPMWKDLS